MVNRAFIFVLLAGTIILLIVLRIQGAELVTPVSPLGILSLEFSGDAKNTELIVSTWKNGMGTAFAWNMIFDFFFIFFYGGMLYFTCIYFSWLMPSWSKFANIMARVALVAAGLDIVENILMIVSWNREINSVITRITLVAAVLKFLLVIISIIAIGIMAVNRSFGMDKRKTL